MLVSLGLVCSSHAGDLQLNVTNIRNANGNILISVFDNARDYEVLSGNAEQYHTFVSLKFHTPSRTVMIPDFPGGTYAAIAVHDENGNNDLDSSFFGIPTEGFSISNHEGKLSEPRFQEAAFTHRESGDSMQILPLIYLN
ncbi:MAG: DUF2141 domain-containing protein [Chromatiales bacterium]|nr:DUF2141 domain-containing protein [Chromatiales bacterium]